MGKKVFEKLIKIRYSEMDYNMVLKPSSLLQFLQDLASDNAEILGFGYSYIIKNNLAWFLLKYHMEFEDYPENIYNLKIKTEARGYNKLFAFRDFALYDGEKLLGRISSTWSLVDLTSKNIVPVPKVLSENQYMQKYEKRENDLIYKKIKLIEQINKEQIYDIRFDDIDINKHVNNANYIIWALESLDFDFRASKKLKTLDIAFKKEIKFGNKILSQVEIMQNSTCHVLKCYETGEELCAISADWIDRK